MKHSENRILSTHAGRLTGANEVMEMRTALQRGSSSDYEAFKATIRPAMTDVIRKQAEAGIDIISDGELGKFGGFAYYGQRLEGLAARPPESGEITARNQRTNDRIDFDEFYADLARNQRGAGAAERMVCVGPISYKGHGQVQSDIDLFKASLKDAGVSPEETFMCVLAPGWIEHSLFNEYYKTDEEFLFALAEAMSHEYKAIVDAGFILQLDDPAIATKYDMIVPNPPIEEYRKIAEVRVEALNHALREIPEDRIRYHLCWGSWHGPHTHDIPLRDIVDLVLKVKAEAYSIEAGNPRHEHEWKVWQDVKLPDGKIIIPGVVSHVSNVVEHPELVADRLIQYANIVGRENVIAGTDCGMGGRIHMQVGWAKLKALSEGSALASKQLWS
jgi:5-methyltetrahydropteroyltriglutamate--homocysteine methyltransferase